MSFFDHPQRLSRPESYFAALNTARGFITYYPTLFAPYRKIVLKDGPGCGKSTLMNKIADHAAEHRLTVKRFYCSSDTDSLDAILLPALSVVVLDGTAPHTVEPYAPGACDRLLDLTVFWDNPALREHQAEISLLNAAIGRKYTRAYALMKSVMSIEEAILAEASLLFDKERAHSLLERLLQRHHVKGRTAGNAPCGEICPTAAFGSKGHVALDTLEKKADIKLHIRDRHVFSVFFFHSLQTLLEEKKIPYLLSPRPIDEQIESLYLPDSRLLITCRATEEADGTINLDRMLFGKGQGASKGQKALLRQLPPLFQAIEKELAEAGHLHGELEKYYIAATDYEALNAFTERFVPALLEGQY